VPAETLGCVAVVGMRCYLREVPARPGAGSVSSHEFGDNLGPRAHARVISFRLAHFSVLLAAERLFTPTTGRTLCFRALQCHNQPKVANSLIPTVRKSRDMAGRSRSVRAGAARGVAGGEWPWSTA
jgi:hypothetical protein